MQLALASSIPVRAWLDEDDATILTALDELEGDNDDD